MPICELCGSLASLPTRFSLCRAIDNPRFCLPKGLVFTRQAALFADENLDLLAHVLDDWFRVPGTSIRFGLDGIIGLVPGLGDIIGGLASFIIVVAAWVRGVPYVTLLEWWSTSGSRCCWARFRCWAKLFDIAWKANRRNYALIVRHLEQSRRQTWRGLVFPGLIGRPLAMPSFWPRSS